MSKNSFNVFLIVLVGGYLFLSPDAFSQSNPKYVTISFIGDVMQHSPQIKSAYDPLTDSYNYHPCFRYIAPSLRSSDITIANLELTLSGEPYSGYPAFSAPDELAMAMKQAGIDVFVTANNHSLDRRKHGVERTIDVLNKFNIPHTGTFKDSTERAEHYPFLIKKNGVKIALLNYTYGTNGIPTTPPNIVNRIDTDQIKADLDKAKSLSPDVIITIMHWGKEYERLPDKEQKYLAKYCKENGADLVIGSHPHVLEPIELNEDRDHLTVYSLGNFVSNQRTRYRDGGMMVTTTLEIDTANHESRIADVGYLLTWVYKKTTPSGNEYYILPAEAFKDDTDFISDESDREKLKLFLSDSRSHFAQNNQGDIREHYHQIEYFPYHYNRVGELVKRKDRQQYFRQLDVKDHDNDDFDEKHNTKSVAQHVEKKNDEPSANNEKVISKKTAKNEPSITYRIQFFVSSTGIDTSSLPKSLFNKIYTEEVNGNTRYLTGDFALEGDAQKRLQEIKASTRFKDAYIVEREVLK